jgi:hypothetical protein
MFFDKQDAQELEHPSMGSHPMRSQPQGPAKRQAHNVCDKATALIKWASMSKDKSFRVKNLFAW